MAALGSDVIDRHAELYSSLKLENKDGNIRVMDLHPGRLKNDIYITLRVVNLAASPRYEAVST